jgi:predicted amidohydrolase
MPGRRRGTARGRRAGRGATGLSRTPNIGLAQITAQPYAVEENLALSVDSAAQLFSDGADVVVLPELIVSGYATERERLAEVAEPVDGPAVQAWTKLAKDAGGLIFGGFCERDGDSLYNAAVAVGADGVVLHYRKLHLFASEKECFAPGDLGLPIAETQFGVIGICVCYDLRFVETARALALQGAELIGVPTAWLPGFDSERWDEHGYSPQARGAQLQANLDQAYIACASQAGVSGPYDFLGSSLLCDPYGKTLLGPLPGSAPELAMAQIDLDSVRRAHERDTLINPRSDRRTDVYGLAVSGTVL